ncbi:hypothetical protein QWY97_10530 [Vibrio cortegadensis]|uniref:hypothetical protein n=1 Tax=Vibrio cortegadensis TaxID=1328770 RepID=UPI0021C2F84B|nr:hypothetical protein [Vibrio cortegadensis]MDN3697781.1 hypothetical protein [Vibrio cortegadensis]
MELNLIEGQKIPVTLDSEWLFVELSTGKIQIEIESTGAVFTLTQKSLYKNTGSRFGRIFITGVGRLVFEHGVGDFTPPMEGQQLEVSVMPAMVIAENQHLTASIDSLPAVEIAAGQTVSLETLPPVEIAPDQVIKVSQRTPVVLKRSKSINAQDSALPVELPFDSSRFKVTIKAATANTGDVLINNAYPLSAGERIDIESSALIALTGAATDRVFILES